MKLRRLLPLFLGDTLALAVITVIGFASHGEVEISFLPRMLTTFLPMLAGWFLVAPWLGLFKPEFTSSLRQLWRPALAMLLAAPLTAVLRGVMLNALVLPLFVLILGASAALGMLVWRGIWCLAAARNGKMTAA